MKISNSKKQPKLHRSFLKYGIEKHKFEVIEECKFEELNIKERYYQDLYDCINNGLNCVYTDTDELPRVFSEETRKKIGFKSRNKKHSEETKRKIGDASRGRIVSKETREKLSKAAKGRIVSAETRLKISTKQIGKIISEETRKKSSESQRINIKTTLPDGNCFIYSVKDTLKNFKIGNETFYKIIRGGYSKKYKNWKFEYMNKERN